MILSDSFRLLVLRNVFLDISSLGREPVPMLERHKLGIQVGVRRIQPVKMIRCFLAVPLLTD